jgi:type I restriction enzyme M protein
VLTNPPYGPLAQSRVGTFEFHAKRYEALFIQHIMAALRPSEPAKKHSRAVVIILDKILFDNSSVFKNIRMKLLREFDLKAVFSMPAGIFQPYSGVKTTVLYFEKPTKEEWNETKKQNAYTTKQVLFVDVKDDGFTLTTQRRPINGAFQGDEPNIYEPPCGNLPKAVEVFRRWIDWINNPTKELPDFIDNDFCWAATIEEIKAKDYNLNPGLYRKTIKGKQKWEVVSLKEICDIQKGTSITRADTVEGNIPVIAGGQEPAYYHNQSNRDGNIITVSASGAYAGFVSYFDVPIFASDCTTIKSSDEEKALTKYIFYVLKSRQEDLYKLQRGAGQPHVYPNDLANIQIPLPPLPVQQELVTRLDKQQAIIEQCNAMERAILEAGIDDSIFEGDWEWVELPDVVEINPESMNPENEPEKEFIYIDISSVDNKTFTITDYKFISGKNAPSRARRVVKIGDVLISTVRPNLKSFCIIDDERFNNQICSTGFAVLRSKNEVILPRFLFFYVLSDIFVSELTKLMEKSQYPSITQTDLSYIKVPLPPIEKQQKIMDFLNVQFETLTNIRRLKENAKQTIKMILDREVFGE